ncbi:RagB/SusD family nutrient uptake outer membrane protein [Maribellus comscasis]|uniref:RagB/SusD family nutrient uptake outer membrane protein n=1 Tax=Maribellus comscasis TaxID=2681766 RepID=A0A6I6K567_9BACT|nr:RagB/SusD family nutrient uptake outer membrane protein [Maribellus comscasis]QGY47572.1 RagB/SusD family nutrient uptake outer membrane protein [Maribellus comscasis]
MKRILTIIIVFLVLYGCNEDFLDREPTTILTEDVVWQDKSLVYSVLVDLYGRIPVFQSIDGDYTDFVEMNNAFCSQPDFYSQFQNTTYAYDRWNTWNYSLLREVNLFIQKATEADALEESSRKEYLAEARFIRGWIYFDMVKRMGGVPLITEPLTYDFSGDPTYLQYARAKEYEVYDFIISEMDAIKGDLPVDITRRGRATNGAAIALKSRAALYAGSIARYGANTPSVSLSGNEVGIPASMAEGYYEKALAASKELITAGDYALYTKLLGTDPSDNFAKVFLDESNNPEIIFAEEYKAAAGKDNGWVVRNQPWSLSEEVEGGDLNPSLNLVQSFEKLDNTFEKFQTTDADGNYIYYDNITDIFANRDARLQGTVIVPGSKFKGAEVDIFAGWYIKATNSFLSGDTYGQYKLLPGETVETQIVGFDGPIDGLEFTAQTGFYMRKFMDVTVGSGQRGTRGGSDQILIRYAEVILNAAEAAFELNQKDVAATYLNMVRSRAGFTIPLTANDMTFDRIVNERKVELAFEGHWVFDLKRWRIAHILYDGVKSELASPGVITEETWTRPFSLWPYKVHDPNGEMDGKYIFREVLLDNVTNGDNFRMGNYYSKISDDVLSNNPKIIQNPNQQ